MKSRVRFEYEQLCAKRKIAEKQIQLNKWLLFLLEISDIYANSKTMPLMMKALCICDFVSKNRVSEENFV